MNDSGEAAINLLTGSHADKDTDTPAYKETSAKMEILKRDGNNPLPKINHRNGNPQPQIGVQVQKKWARKDYIFPGDAVKRGLGIMARAIKRIQKIEITEEDQRKRDMKEIEDALVENKEAILEMLHMIGHMNERGVLPLLRGLLAKEIKFLTS